MTDCASPFLDIAKSAKCSRCMLRRPKYITDVEFHSCTDSHETFIVGFQRYLRT